MSSGTPGHLFDLVDALGSRDWKVAYEDISDELKEREAVNTTTRMDGVVGPGLSFALMKLG